MINWLPLIVRIFTYLKFLEVEIIVDELPHDYETVNELVFEVKGVVSSTVETTI